MSDFQTLMRCTQCGDIDRLIYVRFGEDGKRREPPFRCQICGGEMVEQKVEVVKSEKVSFHLAEYREGEGLVIQFTRPGEPNYKLEEIILDLDEDDLEAVKHEAECGIEQVQGQEDEDDED